MVKYLLYSDNSVNQRDLASRVYRKASNLGYNPVVLVFEDGLTLRTEKMIKKSHIREIERIRGIVPLIQIM